MKDTIEIKTEDYEENGKKPKKSLLNEGKLINTVYT